MDRLRANVFFCAYAYFRWVDDIVDSEDASIDQKTTLLDRQRAWIAELYENPESLRVISSLTAEEQLLFFVIQHDLAGGKQALRLSISDMLRSIEMDATRRGRVVSSEVLTQIQMHRTRAFADFVSTLLHQRTLVGAENRLLVFALACDEAHKLRDLIQDVTFGYFNISFEELREYEIDLNDLNCPGLREYVKDKVSSTRASFTRARRDLRHVSATLRAACLIYGLRHLMLLKAIENDAYYLRFSYVLGVRHFIRSTLREMMWRQQRGAIRARRESILDNIAKGVSAVLSPYNTAFVLLVFASLVSQDGLAQLLAWVSLSFIVFILLPDLILHRLAAAHEISDLDVSVRKERTKPRIATLSMLIVSLPICLARLANANIVVQKACLIFPILIALGYVCSHLWKASGHVSSMMSLITFLYLVRGAPVRGLVPLLLIVAWARIRLGAHNTWETFLGAVIGTLSTLTAWHLLK